MKPSSAGLNERIAVVSSCSIQGRRWRCRTLRRPADPHPNHRWRSGLSRVGVSFGIPRRFVARLFATWPDAGFHWRLVQL